MSAKKLSEIADDDISNHGVDGTSKDTFSDHETSTSNFITKEKKINGKFKELEIGVDNDEVMIADGPKEKSVKNIQVIDLDIPEDTELTCSKAEYPCRPPWKAPSKGTLTLHMKNFHGRSSIQEKAKNNELETRENPNYSDSTRENSDSILNPKIQDLEDFETSEEIQIDDPRSINENEFQNQNTANDLDHIEIVKHEIFSEENKTRVEITIDEKEIYGVIIHKNPNEITLGDLKKHMPISGSFRYFLQVGRIEGKDKYNQYENDANVLPLFRDNIIVKCKSIL